MRLDAGFEIASNCCWSCFVAFGSERRKRIIRVADAGEFAARGTHCPIETGGAPEAAFLFRELLVLFFEQTRRNLSPVLFRETMKYLVHLTGSSNE